MFVIERDMKRFFLSCYPGVLTLRRVDRRPFLFLFCVGRAKVEMPVAYGVAGSPMHSRALLSPLSWL